MDAVLKEDVSLLDEGGGGSGLVVGDADGGPDVVGKGPLSAGCRSGRSTEDAFP